MRKKVIVKNKGIGDGEPTFIIAEIASAHEGSINLMKKLIEAAIKSKADAVKFQLFDADELLVKQHPKYKSLKEIEFNEKEWEEIFEYVKSFEIVVLSDVFDIRSVNIADKYVSGFKVHSTNVCDPSLLLYVAKKKKPTLISTGGSTLNEIKKAIEIFKENKNDDIILMHGYQAFPTKIEKNNLNLIKSWRQYFNYPVGLADHIDAESEMAIIIPLIAVALGANVIEKHITLDRSRKGRDYYSALNPKEFEKMVEMIRLTEKSLGSDEFELSEEEKKYRELMKKYIVAKTRIAKGSKITENQIAFKRTLTPGLLPTEKSKIIGKIAKKDIEKDENITIEKVKSNKIES